MKKAPNMWYSMGTKSKLDNKKENLPNEATDTGGASES